MLSYNVTLRLVRSELIARSAVEVRWLGVTHPCSWTSMNLGQLLNSHAAPLGTSWHTCFSKRRQRPSSSSNLEQLHLSGETSCTIKESEGSAPVTRAFVLGGASMNGRADSRLPSAAQP